MIRVLLVSGSAPPAPCGVGDYTYKLAQSLGSIGKIETAILTSTTVPAEAATGGVLVVPFVANWRLLQIGQIARFIKRWKPNVVHVQYPTQGYGHGAMPYLIPLLARFLGVRTVQTWHEGFRRRDILKLLVHLSAASRQIVVRSNFIDLVHPSLRWAVRYAKPSFIANASAIPRAHCSEEEVISAKRGLLQGQRRLIVFFGFLYPAKGVELLFEIADPQTDHLVIAGPADEGSYLEKLRLLAMSTQWQGRVTFTGFVSPERAALLLAAADAVILPFRQGGGGWNTSIHSAVLNDAFVITTASKPTGYDETTNVYYAHTDDVVEMRSALARYCGRRPNFTRGEGQDAGEWAIIARKHYQIYADLYADGG
jgi:glycosyltransferase involved in cell wall biosynthesis